MIAAWSFFLIQAGLYVESALRTSRSLVKSFGEPYLLVLSCSSIVLSLFSIAVSLSSISLSILPRSSCGPMYCPGLSGEGNGSIGRGRSGSGRLGRSKTGQVKWVMSPFFNVLTENL